MKKLLSMFARMPGVSRGNQSAPSLSSLYSTMFGDTSPITPIITYKPPVISFTGKQTSSFSPLSSDHKMYTEPKTKGITWNLMMQAKSSQREGQAPRSNTAFGHTENQTQYQDRIKENVLKLSEELHNNPDTPYIVFQEAPIGDNYEYFKTELEKNMPKNWCLEHVYMDNTNWGVVTFINKKKMDCKQIERLDLTEGIPVNQLDIRCRTFKLTKNDASVLFLTNIHLPHDSPEAACKGIIRNVIWSQMITPGAKKGEHIIVGDWNIEPTKLDELTKEVVAEIQRDEHCFDKNHPVHLDLSLFSSPEGHLKANGSTLSVDGALFIRFEPSDKNEYTYSFNAEPIERGTAVLTAIAIVAGIGAFFLEEEHELRETSSNEEAPKPINPTSNMKKQLQELKALENQDNIDETRIQGPK
jgi:exonuclease III